MLELNRNSIESANSASQFDAGDVLAREAEKVYTGGLERMREAAGERLNDQQRAILAAREGEFKTLVERAYNDIIARRASWMPWTVCGPARYNAKKNSARADRQMEAEREWGGKIDRFIINTGDMIRDAVPMAELLEQYRDGRRREAISSDDPHAAEKLQARIEGLKDFHERMKARNAYWRKHGTLKGCPGMDAASAAKLEKEINDPRTLYRVPYAPYELQLNGANIKRLEARLEAIRGRVEAGDAERIYNGFTIRQDAAGGRINIMFDDKPGEAARDVLKSNGFHWSPRSKVWTRKATDNAMRAVRAYIVPGLLALEAYSDGDALSLEQFAELHA